MKHLFLTTAICILSATGGIAADDSTWTYSACVDYARQHNISLQKLQVGEQTAAYDLEEAKAQWQPSLDFATTHGVNNYPWADSRNNTYSSSYGFNAGWTVWNGGQRENTIRRDKINVEISRLATDDLMRSIETDLLQVYLNILYARESIAIYEEASKLSKAQAERARQLMEAGRASKVDYAQLNSQYEQDRYALVNARGTYDTRRMELKKLLELGIDTEISLADVEWTAEQILAALPDVDESYRLALDTDVKLRSLALEAEGSKIDIDIAKVSGRPKISLNAAVATGYNAPGAAFGNSMKQNFNEALGLTLSIPILDNKKSRTAVARARAQQLDARLDIQQRHTDLAQLVENWYIDTRSAQARYSAAGEQLVSAELTHELTSEQFNLGLVNPIELMSAHNDLIEARHSLLQAKYMAILGQKMIEFYRTSTITLN